MVPVNGEWRSHLPYLIDMANRRMQAEMALIVDDASFPHLRGAHFRILDLLPRDGARPSALAAAAQMTRPALGELVAHLREHGYVTTETDPTDGRAQVITLTGLGRRTVAEVERAVAELRRRWAEEIGADRVDALLDALAALTVHAADEDGSSAPR